jgi:hypothetical protein
VRRWVVVVLCAYLCYAVEARAVAPGINIAWDACGPAGVANKDFACASNVGVDVFVVSYVAPITMPNPLVGIEADVMVQPPGGAPLPSWWQFQVGGCREGALTLSANRAADTLCLESSPDSQILYWAFVPGYDSPQSGSLLVGAGVGLPGVWITPEVEYFGFRVAVSHAKSTGLDSCGGCANRLTLVLREVHLHGETDTIFLTNPLRQNVITWQGGLVPVRSVTWGQIKGLYR